MSLNQYNWQLEDYHGLFQGEESSQLLQNSLLQKDIWRTKEDLGLETHAHQQILTLNFTKIQPSWLNLLTKLYVKKIASLKLSIQYIKDNVSHFKKFAKFLKEKHIEDVESINNSLFEEFDNWLRSTNISERTISLHYTTLENFFNTCRIEQWLDVNNYWFKGRKFKSKPKNDEIDYIPEEVWNQLEDHLHYFPEPMQRKVLIIRTLGLRIGELLNLPFNCLRKRGNQWRLRLKETEKYKIEDELPVPYDLVVIIKEQQEYIKIHFQNNYPYLFCSNKGGRDFNFIPIDKVMYGNTFNRWLNKLANQCNITSKEGTLWNFTSHQFRRTIGTIMTNAGVQDLIIQKYLRHRNPDMQNHYKHLLRKVIGEEYQEFTKEKNFVNIEGKVVATHKPQDGIEEYMRVKLHQITTQQGECHRSNLKQPCPTVNGCWRCTDWMTSEKDLPYLKQDLQRLQNELEKANKLGMVRVEKEIQKDFNYLQVRIKALDEVISND